MPNGAFAVLTSIFVILIVIALFILVRRISNLTKVGAKPIHITVRKFIFTIFLVNFFIGLFAWLWILGSIPKEFLGTFYGTFTMVTGFYSIILGACFLAVVYWVWDDDERLRKLEEPSLKTNT